MNQENNKILDIEIIPDLDQTKGLVSKQLAPPCANTRKELPKLHFSNSDLEDGCLIAFLLGVVFVVCLGGVLIWKWISHEEETTQVEEQQVEKCLCYRCEGSGECSDCGNGYRKCTFCDGSGLCFGCDGSGIKNRTNMRCYVCKDYDIGKCSYCEGTGHEICRSCDGTNVCSRCKGTGEW